MKRKLKIVYILFLTFLLSCNPFDEKRVLDYKIELQDLISKLDQYEDGTYGRDEIDEFIIANIRDLDIDFVIKNSGSKNPSYSGFIEENDSLVIFIKRSNNMFDSEKRIIYDFSQKPRNFGSENIINASYRIIQLDKRWYYSEIGFD